MDSPISHGLLAENTREPEISDTNENVFQTFETEIKSNDVGFSVYLRPFSFLFLRQRSCCNGAYRRTGKDSTYLEIRMDHVSHTHRSHMVY
jgi:hypothetical protein